MSEVGQASLVQRLLDEREIEAVLVNYCRGVDRLDAELLRSVYHPDAIDNHGATFRGNAHEFVDVIIERLSRASRTLHTIGNVTIDIRGDHAWVESYFLVYHHEDRANPTPLMNPAGTDLLAAGRYVDKFEKRDGAWKILRRDVLREFTRIDPTGAELPSPADGPRSTRAADDPSYARD
jgi:hypothetical protein